MTQKANMFPVVEIKDGRAVATSKDVADYFGKTHHHVWDAIDALLSEAPRIAPDFRGIELAVKVGFGTRKTYPLP